VLIRPRVCAARASWTTFRPVAVAGWARSTMSTGARPTCYRTPRPPLSVTRCRPGQHLPGEVACLGHSAARLGRHVSATSFGGQAPHHPGRLVGPFDLDPARATFARRGGMASQPTNGRAAPPPRRATPASAPATPRKLNPSTPPSLAGPPDRDADRPLPPLGRHSGPGRRAHHDRPKSLSPGPTPQWRAVLGTRPSGPPPGHTHGLRY